MKRSLLLAIVSFLSLSLFAQVNPQATVVLEPSGPPLAFSVSAISGTVEAVNYRHRDGATNVDLAGTALLPTAGGKAKVRSKRGTMEVEAEFGNLRNPMAFGNEYLTYVLWAVSPEGRAANLGEILTGGNERSKLTATTDFPAFALIVTAEPYYAVPQPSNVIVLANVIRRHTKGTTEEVNLKLEPGEHEGFSPTGYRFDPVVLNAKLPLEFYEARNALRIAQSQGADKYASDSYRHAAQLMKGADDYAIGKHIDRNRLIAVAREAVQTAEDAREIAVKRMDEDRQKAEREASRDARQRLQIEADDASRLKEQAQSDAAKAQAEIAALKTATTAAIAAAQADADKSRSIAQEAQQRAQQADRDMAAMRAQLRAQLSDQLNKILETRESERGLVVSLSDVLFDAGAHSLKPDARIKLAKVAGILSAYPGLTIEIGFCTGNSGSDETGRKLSEDRTGAIRDYLVEQGFPSPAVNAKGADDTLLAASNDAPAGRQENRGVELVVSGDTIARPAGATTASLR